MPSYPQYLPPHKPSDKLLVFTDEDGDGKADKMETFADDLHLPTGFELGDGGVYVAQEPNLVFLKDTNGDGKADLKKILLGGFDSGDSHHAIGAFSWGLVGESICTKVRFMSRKSRLRDGSQRMVKCTDLILPIRNSILTYTTTPVPGACL